MLLEAAAISLPLLPFHEVQLRVIANQAHGTETPSRTWFPPSLLQLALGRAGARSRSGQKQLGTQDIPLHCSVDQSWAEGSFPMRIVMSCFECGQPMNIKNKIRLINEGFVCDRTILGSDRQAPSA